MSRPLVLLPPSKGKAVGGDGPRYEDVVACDRGPLAAARRVMLDAVLADVRDLGGAEVARLAGVAAERAEQARGQLLALADAPTLAAHARYTGVVHGNAGLASLDPRAAGADVRVVSPLLGLAALDDPTPDYRLEFTARLPSLGGVAPFWRARVSGLLAELGAGRRVWDLLPGEHARIWEPGVRDALADLVAVSFVRPDGRPANAARTKVCKGRLTAVLLHAPDLDAPGLARRAKPGEGWTLRAEPGRVIATCHL
ncbi:peroxide stress protein YaaA [Egicoccus sp. AB-alg6-2]|uniref:peroxide stress protein YaaA n=1 Tax=Egicoccus sp. AB-alg6-2 TaxID=3242692 RepID=UPI00359CD6F1